jgi:mRNA interferase RelE/StbE
MIEVVLQEEVLDYLRTLPPQPKQALRKGIRGLAEESGDILPLTNELDGFHRLRVGRYRVIFRYETVNGQRRIVCIYVAQRKWVYEVFQSRLLGE